VSSSSSRFRWMVAHKQILHFTPRKKPDYLRSIIAKRFLRLPAPPLLPPLLCRGVPHGEFSFSPLGFVINDWPCAGLLPFFGF